MPRKEAIAIELVLIAILSVIHPSALAREYEPHGRKEDLALERKLQKVGPAIYTYGIRPRAEILSNAKSVQSFPAEYVQTTERLLRRVLNVDMPSKMDRDGWKCIGSYFDLRNPSIIGSFKTPGESVFFLDDEYVIGLLIESDAVTQVDTIDTDSIRGVFSKLLRIPKEQIEKMDVQYQRMTVNGESAIYGLVQCDWNYRKDSVTRFHEARWWSYMPFWIKKGTFFVSVSTIDWQKSEMSPKPGEGLKRDTCIEDKPPIPLASGILKIRKE